jgi:hypothetical protein
MGRHMFLGAWVMTGVKRRESGPQVEIWGSWRINPTIGVKNKWLQ